jgi:hypothetical protein
VGSTRLVYTGLRWGLVHLKIETRLIDERFASVMGECVILTPQVYLFASGKSFFENLEFVYYESIK